MTSPAKPEKTALQADADAFRLLVDRVRDYAIYLLDPDGHVASWNEGARRAKGYEANEIIGRHVSTFYTPEDVARRHPQALLKRAEEEGRVEDEGWRVRKDGTRFWADVVITALRDDNGELRGFAKVTRDLSERREADLALAELSGRLLRLQDEERRRIARELHDSTSPLLTGLVSKLYAARNRATHDPALARIIEDALSNAETTATVVRTVSSLLHPPLLDESGLLPSLRWYLDTLSKRTDMRIDVAFPAAMARLPHDVELTLFRVVQEGVGSLMREAGAKKVSVSIAAHGEIVLSIRGDAVLSADKLAEMRAGRGDLGVAMVGARERLRAFGGQLRIETGGDTTTVSVSVPSTAR